MPQKAGKAGERQRRIDALYNRFERLLEHAESARLAMGSIIAGLRAEEESWTSIARELKTRFPKGPQQLGHEFTVNAVKAMLNVHEVFDKGNGIESPDGKWHIDAEHMDALSLTSTQLSKATELAQSGKLPIKKLVRQAARALRGQQQEKPELVTEARDTVVTMLGEKAPATRRTLPEQLEAAKKEQELARKNLARVQERVREADKAVADLQSKVKAAMDKSNAKLSGSKVTPSKKQSARKHAATGATAPA